VKSVQLDQLDVTVFRDRPDFLDHRVTPDQEVKTEIRENPDLLVPVVLREARVITDHPVLLEIKDLWDFLDHQEVTVNLVNVDSKVCTEKRETKVLVDSPDHQDLEDYKVFLDQLDLKVIPVILDLLDLLVLQDSLVMSVRRENLV